MNIFEKVRVRRPRRNKFDLSHERKMSMNMGWLYPCLVMETVPGDKFRVKSEVFLRFLALIAPVMHRVDVTIHYFFVPNRLLWSNWEDFITGGRDGLQAPVIPYFNVSTLNTAAPTRLKQNQLLDYLGFPVMKTADSFNAGYAGLNYSALPLRAYLLIYDQYYRNQNVEASQLTANFKADGAVTGADLLAITFLRPKGWEKDYLTSCLPWTQRGNPVSVPITSNVTYRKPSIVRRAADDAALNTTGGLLSQQFQGAAGTGNFQVYDNGGSALTNAYLDNISSISSSSLTINALRASMRLQEWLEKNALGGGRYIEQIAAHFGVISSDARLQRVEYLGGGRQPVVISENLQTSPATGGSTPLATLSGAGLSVGQTNQFSKFFEEHGIVMGIINIMPRTAYTEALPKIWGRIVNTDYYFPEFAHLGEQTVGMTEAYLNLADAGAAGQINNVFGYQSRYAEYKYMNSTVHGEMRNALAYWTMNRSFATAGYPSLSPTFIYAGDTVRNDVFAVQSDTHHIVAQILHRIDALRPMPYFGTPSM